MSLEKKPKITEYKDSKSVIEFLRTPEQLATKEYIFRNIIENKALDSFKDEMVSSGFTEDQIEEFESMLSEDPDVLPKILCYPYELKKKFISRFQKNIAENKMDLRYMYDMLKKDSLKNNPKIAYHCSAQDIRPGTSKDAQFGEFEIWDINGTEKDHRDDDLPMAYYSFDYLNLYRNKNPKYLYLIRSVPRHRTDGVEWGRAQSLSIIDRMDLREVDQEVENQYQEYLKQENEDKKEAKPDSA